MYSYSSLRLKYIHVHILRISSRVYVYAINLETTGKKIQLKKLYYKVETNKNTSFLRLFEIVFVVVFLFHKLFRKNPKVIHLRPPCTPHYEYSPFRPERRRGSCVNIRLRIQHRTNGTAEFVNIIIVYRYTRLYIGAYYMYRL